MARSAEIALAIEADRGPVKHYTMCYDHPQHSKTRADRAITCLVIGMKYLQPGTAHLSA